ncbi:hypothetical protein [Streptomyces sp. NPDC048650]|uniref:hypothetical protein n=1 Tax=unclassified Streptomyces TaxID=2593676 RepID=UPI00371C1A78
MNRTLHALLRHRRKVRCLARRTAAGGPVTRTRLPGHPAELSAAMPATLPPGYVAARPPVIAGPDGDELRVRAWLHHRIGGAA